MYDGSVATAVTIITVLGDGIGKAKGKLTWRKQAVTLKTPGAGVNERYGEWVLKKS